MPIVHKTQARDDLSVISTIASLRSQDSQGSNIAPSLTCCVTLGKLLPLSELQLSHWKNALISVPF